LWATVTLKVYIEINYFTQFQLTDSTNRCIPAV